MRLIGQPRSVTLCHFSYKDTIVLYDGSEFTPIPLADQHKKSGRIFYVQQVDFTKSCWQIWWRVNQPFIHHIWVKQYNQTLSGNRTDFGRNLLFFALFKPEIEVFHNFAGQIALIQYPAQSNALPLHNKLYRIDHIVKRFHEENSAISGLFRLIFSYVACRVK